MGTALILVLIGFGALAAGILIGRYYVPDDRMLRRTARHARSYMRAVNHLLARNVDDAIDELKKVVGENVEDIEPYFALGALFRSRGEGERAIRVHQAIALRESGSKKLQLRAMYELGLDFRAAGMPRRATRAMEEVLASDGKHAGALRALCGLYEEQGRYAEAASAWRRLDRLRGGEASPREHHLLVAAAQRAIEQRDHDSAKRLLRDAEKLEEDSPHLLVAAAELASARGNHKGASARLRQALAVAPDLARFLVPGLIEAERNRIDAEYKPPKLTDGEPPPSADDIEADKAEATARAAVAALDEVLETTGPSPHLALARAELRSSYDAAGALEDYRDIADDFPDILPARVCAARLALAADDADDIRAELHALAAADGTLSWATDGVWRCGTCGHRGKGFFWRCAGCRRWASARLDVGREALEPPPPPPRERRELPRPATPQALLGAADAALPEPGLDSGLSDDELTEVSRRPSAIGRVGAWLSGAWGGIRGSKRPKELPK